MDVILVFWGIGMIYIMQVVEELVVMGILVEVINLCIIWLLDIDMVLVLVCKIGWVVIIEEVFLMCLVLFEIVYQVQEKGFDYFDVLILCVIGKDVLMLYVVNLEKLVLLNVGEVIDVVKVVIYMV